MFWDWNYLCKQNYRQLFHLTYTIRFVSYEQYTHDMNHENHETFLYGNSARHKIKTQCVQFVDFTSAKQKFNNLIHTDTIINLYNDNWKKEKEEGEQKIRQFISTLRHFRLAKLGYNMAFDQGNWFFSFWNALNDFTNLKF